MKNRPLSSLPRRLQWFLVVLLVGPPVLACGTLKVSIQYRSDPKQDSGATVATQDTAGSLPTRTNPTPTTVLRGMAPPVTPPPTPLKGGEVPPARATSTVTLSPLAGHLTSQLKCDSAYNSGQRSGWWEQDSPRVWSPDGRMVAYSTNVTGDAKLHLGAADGTELGQIGAPDKAFPLGIPVWSPDGQRLAISNLFLSQPGGGRIYVIKPDGSGLTEVATYTGYYDTLAWSPDSTQLAFTSGQPIGAGSSMSVRDYQIYVVAVDGTGQPRIMAAGCQPAWLP